MEVLTGNRILIIQTAFLGDAVLTLPMIRQLKLLFGNSKITVLCIPSTREVFDHSKYVDETIVYDKRNQDKSLVSFFRLISRIRGKQFTHVYSPHRSLRSALISFFSNAKNTTGFNIATFPWLYKNVIGYDPGIHEVARNLSLIGYEIKNERWKILPELEIPDEIKNRTDELLKNFIIKKIIAVAPGSVWQTKIYPENYYIELIDLLISNEFEVLLIGGKEDKILCERIAANFKEHVIAFAGKVSVLESVEILKKCNALICNDSAPTHLAMIAGIPVLTIYCSTVPAFGFYPYSNKSMFISYDDLKCKPCGIHGHKKCPVKTFDCAINLRPQQVFQKLKEIIPV